MWKQEHYARQTVTREVGGGGGGVSAQKVFDRVAPVANSGSTGFDDVHAKDKNDKDALFASMVIAMCNIMTMEL